jgi:hypothetical protein
MMDRSRNPIEELTRALGFEGKTAEFLDWLIFAVIMFILIGVLLGGL